MRIAIIGAGNVGGTLGTGWARRGHEVIFGVRDASDPKLKELLSRAGGKARAAGVKEAAAAAEVVARSCRRRGSRGAHRALARRPGRAP